MKKEWWNTNHKGFSLVEVILSGSVFVLFVTALAGVYLYGQETTMLSGNRTRAVLLAQEGMEAVRSIQNRDFGNLTNGVYGLSTTGNLWNLSGSHDALDIFTRYITISTLDAQRKNVSVSVTWQQNLQRTGEVQLDSLFSNWQREVLLVGDWSQPILESSIDLSGTNDAIKVQIQNDYAYVIRTTGSPRLAIIDISNPSTPVLTGSLALASSSPRNIFVSGNYAYIAGSGNSSELQIVDISSPASPVLVSTYDAAGNADGYGIFVSGTTAYLTRANSGSHEFIAVNVSNPVTPALLGGLDLNGSAWEVSIKDSYAYIASSDNSQELQIIHVSNPAIPTLAGTLDASGTSDALSVAISGNMLLLGQGDDLRIFDITNPTTPTLTGSVGLSGVVNDVALNLAGEQYAFIGVSRNSGEFQVVDTSALSVLSTIDISGNNPLSGIAYNETLDTAVGVGSSNTQEIIIFLPQ